MQQFIEIRSDNFSGQSVNIIFVPDTSTVSYNLGNQEIPFDFYSTTISPTTEIYGIYTIEAPGVCDYFLTIPD